MIVRKVNMSLSVLLVLTAGVSSYMPDRFMDETHLTRRSLAWKQSSTVKCGRVLSKPDHRKALGASRMYIDDVPDLHKNVNDVTHLNEPVSDVPVVDTHVQYVPNPGSYVFEVPNLNDDVDDDLSPDTYVDNVPSDKNTSDEPEIEEDVSEESHLEKILGGHYATRGELPWQVNVRINSGWNLYYQICGGSIISEFWIITAAHCITNHPANLYHVVVGDHLHSRSDPGEQTFEVEKLLPHENYRRSVIDYDIGLIKVKPTSNGRGIIFGDTVQPACLPLDDSEPSAGTELLVSGWGKTNTNSQSSPDMLKLTKMPIMSSDSCRKQFGLTSQVMFCAGYFNQGTTFCKSDSGGPAVYKKEGIHILYGIISASMGCGYPNHPVVLTNVACLLSWIQQNIHRNSANVDEERIPSRSHSKP